MNPQTTRCTAFEGPSRIASGVLADVALRAKSVLDRRPRAPVLIFDDADSHVIEVDFRGEPADVLRRLQERAIAEEPARAEEPAAEPVTAAPRRGPGRPKLGVVAREVTLLPRHWEWLANQPGGASVALRKLVEDARRGDGLKERARKAQEAAYRFMSAMAGDRPGFEEASRALFAGDRAAFDFRIKGWPADIRDHAARLAAGAFAAPA